MLLGHIFISLATLLHVYFFVLESLTWGSLRTNKIFGLNPDQANQTKLLAFNQGFYNLFLVIAILAGFIFYYYGQLVIAMTLVAYAALSMIAAAIVLFISKKGLFRAALVQGLPPLLALIFYSLYIVQQF